MKTKLLANLYRFAGAAALGLGAVSVFGRNGRMW